MYFSVNLLFFVLSGFNHFTAVFCVVKTWRYNVDISNPENWLEKRPQEHCNGLVFPAIEKDVYIDKLLVKSIVFPIVGSIGFTNGGFIEFEENSKSELNCVTLKTFPHREFLNADAWITQGESNNSAVPHAERPPCSYDDVVFPSGIKTGSVYLDEYEEDKKVKSFQFGNRKFTTDREFQDFIRSDVPYDIFGSVLISVDNKECEDPTGCLCGNEFGNYCENVYEESNFECLNPISPIGFCDPICGSTIQFKPKNGFVLKKLQEKLKDFESDTYASKVLQRYQDEVIQVIFSEKDFTGNSLSEAKDFADFLKNEYYVSNLNMTSSGYPTKNNVATVALMILGTLFVAVVVFALLFYVYNPQFYRRMGLMGNRPVSTYFFARYDNIEDRGYIYEGERPTVEAVSEKSFENPLFGKASPSTSEKMDKSGSVKGENSSTHENPLYEIMHPEDREITIEPIKEEEILMKNKGDRLKKEEHLDEDDEQMLM